MNKFARIAAAAAVAAFFATPSFAAPVGASPAAKAKVAIVKPLTLTKVLDLDFGTLTLGNNLGATPVTISLDRTTGNIGCATDVTCPVSGTRGEYKVTGVNNNTVTINVASSNLSNLTTPTAAPISFTPTAQTSVALGNSGAAGVNFLVGGSISVSSATAEGNYSGDMDVTVNY